MIDINLYAIPPLLCSIIVLTAGLVVLLNKKHEELNQSFFALCFSTATWLSFYGINFSLFSQSPVLRQLILKIGYCGVSFISITFLNYFLTFLNTPQRKLILALNTVYGLILTLLIFKTNVIISGFYHYRWGYYPAAGKLHPYFLILFLSHCIVSNYLLLQKYKKHPPSSQKANQIKYLFISFGIFTLACWDFIPNYGIELYPFGYVPATIFILIIFYAIIKHKLMDINIVINRSIVYSLLITTITIIYLLFVLLVERFSQNIFRYNSLIVSILSAFIIAIIFVPLKNQIQKLIDRLFLKQSPFELASENQLLRENAVHSEKMKTIATLASGIAHEIRNPLTALKTFVEYFPKKKNDPQFIAKFESIAGTEINRIESILNELLAFAKPSALSLNDTDIKQTLEHAINLTANQLNKNKVTLNTDFADNIPAIKADTNKLLQVFINLILNANDAMADGGTLRIVARGSGLGASSSTNDQPPTSNIQIVFTDTGSGIEPKDLAKIFDPFFSTKEKGTGLGLAIVKGIIENHSGKITVQSIKHQGTTFTITLPTTSSTNEVQA